MSTTSNVEYNNSNPIFLQRRQEPCSSIVELRQRAHIDTAETEAYSVKRWIDLVIELFEKVKPIIGRAKLVVLIFFFHI
jgi:hypothetical protein